MLVFGNATIERSGYYLCKANNSYGTILSRKAKFDLLETKLPVQTLSLSIDIL